MKILKIHENASFFKITSRVSMGSRIGVKTIYNTQTSHLQASELIPYIISEILTFFDFYEIYVGYKSFHLWVNCRNLYPKISSLKSVERVDIFCTINRKFSTITTKLTQFSNLIIVMSNWPISLRILVRKFLY